VDRNGTVRLLKEVTQLWKDGVTTNNASGQAVVQTPGHFVLVTEESLFALLHVGGSPRRIEMMQCDETFLNIRPRAHFLRAAHENPFFSRLHFLEQSKFFNIAVVVLHEGDFFGRNAALHKLGFQVVVIFLIELGRSRGALGLADFRA